MDASLRFLSEKSATTEKPVFIDLKYTIDLRLPDFLRCAGIGFGLRPALIPAHRAACCAERTPLSFLGAPVIRGKA